VLEWVRIPALPHPGLLTCPKTFKVANTAWNASCIFASANLPFPPIKLPSYIMYMNCILKKKRLFFLHFKNTSKLITHSASLLYFQKIKQRNDGLFVISKNIIAVPFTNSFWAYHRRYRNVSSMFLSIVCYLLLALFFLSFLSKMVGTKNPVLNSFSVRCRRSVFWMDVWTDFFAGCCGGS
jgi:hypothetical protein